MADDVLQVAPESLLSVTFQPVEIMIDEVAGLVGGTEEPDTRNKAILALDRAADWINMSGIFMYTRKELSVTSFTADQQTLDRPADWGWPDEGARVYDPDGDLLDPLEWLDWDAFQQQIEVSDSSVPEWLSMRSDLNDNISVYPYIDNTQIGEIVVPYLTRITRISENNEVLVTPETRESLICGGEAYIMRRKYKNTPNIWTPFWRQFTNSITLAKGAADRYRQVVHTGARPDESGRLPRGSNAFRRFGNLTFTV